MTSLHPVPWQNGRSLLGCHRYMFEHEIGTDVSFTFPHAGQHGVCDVRAHRYVLICRSPVFEVMLTTDNYLESSSTSGSISITDIEKDVFKELLRYMYQDDARLDGGNVLQVLYAAKKYLLNGLIEKCRCYIREETTPENVGMILNNAISFSENEMIQYCLGYIALHADEVFESKAFLNFSQQALHGILQCNGIGLGSESDLFHKCMQWARSQDGAENTKLKSVRDSLGTCLCELRFSSMTAKELAQVIAMEPEVLTFEEQASFFRYIADPDAGVIEIQQSGRDLREYQVDRFPFVRSGKEKPLKHDTDVETISFRSDTLVNLHAISVYGDATKATQYTLNIVVKNGEEIMIVGTAQITSNGTREPITLRNVFDKPFLLFPGVAHDLTVTCTPSGKHRYYGISGWDTIKIESVTFNFETNNNEKSVLPGHVAQLFFTKVT